MVIMWLRLASNSRQSSCFSLLCTEMTSMYSTPLSEKDLKTLQAIPSFRTGT